MSAARRWRSSSSRRSASSNGGSEVSSASLASSPPRRHIFQPASLTEALPALAQPRLLGGCALASENAVAVWKAPEALDHRAMLLGVLQHLGEGFTQIRGRLGQ